MNTNNINKTSTQYKTNGDILDEPNIVFTRKMGQTSQHGTKNVNTRITRTKTSKKNIGVNSGAPEG